VAADGDPGRLPNPDRAGMTSNRRVRRANRLTSRGERPYHRTSPAFRRGDHERPPSDPTCGLLARPGVPVNRVLAPLRQDGTAGGVTCQPRRRPVRDARTGTDRVQPGPAVLAVVPL